MYFDIVVKNTTSLFVALHNAPESTPGDAKGDVAARSDNLLEPPKPDHLTFHPFPANQKPAPPVSLLARIDEEEYVLLSNSSSLISVCLDSLALNQEHQIRIVAPMIDDDGRGVVELEVRSVSNLHPFPHRNHAASRSV